MNFFLANKRAFGVIAFLTFFYFVFFLFLSAPTDFPAGTIIKIEQGKSLRSVSFKLKQARAIRSRVAFEAFAIMYGGDKHIVSSDYLFESKLPVYEIARRIAKGEHHLPVISITIPEGFDLLKIADTIAPKLSNFNKDEFLQKAKGLEGYLFPDTYFFISTNTESDVIKSMRDNFGHKIEIFKSEILLSGKTLNDIIKVASIIEKESKNDADRDFISGILWKRLSVGMLLQVDVAPETYKTKGLPKSPIANPGLASIKAALHPQSSSYFFFLYDKNDHIHYAKSFAEHQRNVLKYLK